MEFGFVAACPILLLNSPIRFAARIDTVNVINN
jgi:hypothetical protein